MLPPGPAAGFHSPCCRRLGVPAYTHPAMLLSEGGSLPYPTVLLKASSAGTFILLLLPPPRGMCFSCSFWHPQLRQSHHYPKPPSYLAWYLWLKWGCAQWGRGTGLHTSPSAACWSSRLAVPVCTERQRRQSECRRPDPALSIWQVTPNYT